MPKENEQNPPKPEPEISPKSPMPEMPAPREPGPDIKPPLQPPQPIPGQPDQPTAISSS